ncbi:2989_t:CDS:2, partial [Cetraspora pellucida]
PHESHLALAICDGERPPMLPNISKFFKNLIQECWNEDPSKRPTAEKLYYSIEEEYGKIILNEEYYNELLKVYNLNYYSVPNTHKHAFNISRLLNELLKEPDEIEQEMDILQSEKTFEEKAIIPLVKLLSFVTKDISLKVNPAFTGLLNATFGNTTELIISIFALCAEEIKIEALIPATFNISLSNNNKETLALSRETAIILLLAYMLYLLFQLKMHSHLYNEEQCLIQDEEQAEEPQLPLISSIIFLFIITGLISLSSNFLVNSFEGVIKTLGFTETFIGLIILPIIGNAAEHITAVIAARKDKMNIAISIAVGFSIDGESNWLEDLSEANLIVNPGLGPTIQN